MHKSPQSAQDQRVSWGEKISYGLADTGFNFYWTNISTFLLFFYTEVFGITAAAAGFMMTTVKLINAFTDPLIGAFADRTS
ncbi:MAG TPA: MFS transporter, partial [Marinagarivorans sp.]|nr:MFS transporter [Marinagarivorans sp.]